MGFRSIAVLSFNLLSLNALAADPCRTVDDEVRWTNVNGQDGCELFQFQTKITNFLQSAGKDMPAILGKIGPKGQELASMMEKTPLVDHFFHAGDGNLATTEHQDVTSSIRSGFIHETGECKGAVVFLEGLGDSMLNHIPLFKTLSRNGYRVIAFDDMGQGGSQGGQADDNRIEDIPVLGEQLYERYTQDHVCKKKIIIGWSIGGLAAYYWASDHKTDEQGVQKQLNLVRDTVVARIKAGTVKNVPKIMSGLAANMLDKAFGFIMSKVPSLKPLLDKLPSGPQSVDNSDINAVILIAPALAVQPVPGDTNPLNLTKISTDLFTPSEERQKLYVDPIVPERVLSVPNFGGDLFVNSLIARAADYVPIPNPSFGKTNLHDLLKAAGLADPTRFRLALWTVPAHIQGLAFVAGNADRFVDSAALIRESTNIAPQFTWVSFEGFGNPPLDPPALHGLDNERPEISDVVKSKILDFLAKL